MGALGWSGAGDDDLLHMQNGLRGLGLGELGGSDAMGGTGSQLLFGSSSDAQSAAEMAEKEQARLQVGPSVAMRTCAC